MYERLRRLDEKHLAGNILEKLGTTRIREAKPSPFSVHISCGMRHVLS